MTDDKHLARARECLGTNILALSDGQHVVLNNDGLVKRIAAEFSAVEREARQGQTHTAVIPGIQDTLDAEREKVVRLREALGSIERNGCCDPCQEAARVARSALAATAPEVKP